MIDPTRIVPLWQALCAVVALGCLTGNWYVIRAALGLLVNWCVLTTYATAMGDQYCWWLNGAVDYATAMVTLLPVASRWQAILAGTFATGLVFHASYGLSAGLHADMVRYWWRFHYLAWSQVLIVLSWGCAEFMGRLGYRLYDRRGVQSLGTGGYVVRTPHRRSTDFR